jgi:hypothetical protein
VKTICRSIISALVIGLLALMPLQSHAQSAPEPAVVISIAKVQEQLADANYLVDAAGFGQMAFIIKVQADQFLKGVDATKAAGILMYFSEDAPEPKALAFIPVQNMDDILNTVANNLGEVDEGEDHTTITADSGQEIHVKKVGDYAFLSDNAALFENIPADPQAELGSLPTKYNLAAKIFGQRIPPNLRQKAIDMIRDGYEAQLEQLGQEGDLATDLQKENFDFQMEQLESMINETDSVVIGMAADKDAKSMYMDVEMTGLEGSPFAKRCQATMNAKPSKFLGFVNQDCAFNMNSCFSILPEDAKNYKKMIGDLREQGLKELEADGDLSDEDMGKIKAAADEVIGVINETLDEGVLDSGLIARVKKGDINLAAGARLANPQKIEGLVKENIGLLKKEMGDKLQVNLNSGSHMGVTLHTLVMAIPEEEEEIIDNFGDEVTIVLGIGEKAIYIAAGNDPLPLLKEAMDKSASASAGPNPLALQWNVYLAPLFKFGAGIENNEIVEAMAEKLAEVGNDRIGITSSMMDNGMKMRFDIQDGILQLISAATEAMGQGAVPGGNDF